VKEKQQSSQPDKNFAFIDMQNLHQALRQLGWKLDYKRFRDYLTKHYNIDRAFMFMGYKPEEQALYTKLQESGFILVFKPTFEKKDGTVKGNCDAEMVLQVMIDWVNYDKALIVSGDGDFYCVVKFLKEQKKLLTVLAPSEKTTSSILTSYLKGEVDYVSAIRRSVGFRKRPVRKKQAS